MTTMTTFPHTLDIHVTDSDLRWGWTESNWFQHPLAMAASRAVPEGHFAIYRGRRIEVLTDGCALRASYRVPRGAQQFVRDYYQGFPPSPGTFTLTLTHTH